MIVLKKTYSVHQDNQSVKKIDFISTSLPEPTISEMTMNFVSATSKWAASGFPVVSNEMYQDRMKICSTCEFWDANARFGMGKCKAPGCGCTRLKQWLKTEKCPKDKW